MNGMLREKLPVLVSNPTASGGIPAAPVLC